MELERFDYVVASVAAVLCLALVSIIAAGDQVGARIIRTLPEDGGEVGGESRLGVEFAQAMQVASIEERFEIEPATSGKFQWHGNQFWFVPNQPFQPGIYYTARLRAGGLSQGGQPMKKELTWRFAARDPWVVYQVLANNALSLWRIHSHGGPPEQLAGLTGDIYDFAVSRDGQQIAYSMANDKRGSDLWLINSDDPTPQLLLDCGPDNCYGPAWSPDGSQIAYNRAPTGPMPGKPGGPSRIWVATIASSQTEPLVSDSQQLGASPSWSPDGNWLAFFDQNDIVIHIVNLQTKQEIKLHSLLAAPGLGRQTGARCCSTIWC